MARVLSAIVCAVLVLVLHMSLHEGQAVRQWGVLENDISILPRYESRFIIHETSLLFS